MNCTISLCLKLKTTTMSNSKNWLSLLSIFLLLSFSSIAQNPSSGCGGGGDDENCLGCGGGLRKFLEGLGIYIPTLHATDPNEIQGPLGIAAKQWMSVKDRLGYTVRFENDPDFANGPAQKVIVTVPIDSSLDINSLRIGNFGFGNLFFIVPPNSPTYYKRLDLRDSLGLYVDVLAGINIINHEAIWVFESIDPATGAEPIDATMGFLPVRDTSINRFNDSIPNKGEGFVEYSIKPKSNLNTGDTVRAQAGIIFDLNAPVLTNTWFNTIDAQAPTSEVTLLPSFVDPSFPVQWSGADDPNGAGLRDYDIYVSKDNGAFQLLLQQTTSTGLQFTGGATGSTYSFYSLATDVTGNREANKNTGDHSTVVSIPLSVICPGNNTFFKFTQPSGGTYIYQWQVDIGNGAGFINLSNSAIYSGTNADSLKIINPPTSWYGYKYRCDVTGTNGHVVSGQWVLKFSTTWNGSANTAWENPANWSCNVIPDGFIDVVINPSVPNYPQVNSNAACRSLKLGNGVVFTVMAGYKLDIKGK